MPDTPTDGLNPDQLDAVVHGGGPLLVVAGAGSGKTRVLTHRIAHLIDEGVHPGRILAITFTNKAADEMRQRVEALVGPVVRSMWVSTFHSACVRILRANADRLGYPRSFSIYDQADAVRLTGYVIRDLALDAKRFPPRGVHAVISLWKNELVDPDAAAARAENIFDRKRADVYREYQARLHKAGAMDFDDLLVNTVRLFRDHPDVLESYRQRFEHILVDEYQDTNQSQNEIVLLLAGGHQNVTVVGDTDQCLPAGTRILTPAGEVPIEEIDTGDDGYRCRRPADGADWRGHPRPPLRRRRAGRPCRARPPTATTVSIVATPFHIVPARLVAVPGSHLVYLMHRADRGFRIGRTTGIGNRPSTPTRCGCCEPVRRSRRLPSTRRCTPPGTGCRPRASTPTGGAAMDDRWLTRLYDELDTGHVSRRCSTTSCSTRTSRTIARRTVPGGRRSTSRCTRTRAGRLSPGRVVVEPADIGPVARAGPLRRQGPRALRNVLEGLRQGARRREASRRRRRSRHSPAARARRGRVRPDADLPPPAGHGSGRRTGRPLRPCDRRIDGCGGTPWPGVRPRGRRRLTPTWPTACWCTTACTAFGAPTTATSCSSRTPSPRSPRWSSTRTTGARRTSSTPPTR